LCGSRRSAAIILRCEVVSCVEFHVSPLAGFQNHPDTLPTAPAVGYVVPSLRDSCQFRIRPCSESGYGLVPCGTRANALLYPGGFQGSQDLELTAGPQDVSVSANCVDQLFIVAIIDLAAQSGDIDLDHVAEFLPVVIVEMFEELRF